MDGWEVRQGTYFQDVMATKYDGGMDAKFEFTEDGDAVFSGKLKCFSNSIILNLIMHFPYPNCDLLLFVELLPPQLHFRPQK